MAHVAPSRPRPERHQVPSPVNQPSRSAINAITKIALISAVLICAAALLVPWRLLTASSAKRAVAANRPAPASAPAQIYALPPTLVVPPALATLPLRKPKPWAKPWPTPALHPRAVTPMPTGVPGDWALTFDGEFNGTSLDTAQWSTGWYGSGITPPVDSSEDNCDDPAEVSEGGGVLSLSLVQQSENCDGQENYAAGLVSTMGSFTFTYGFIEARVWLPGVPGSPGEVANWPGVWADGQIWPEDGEIDIAEGIGGQVCAHFHDAENTQGIGAGGGTGCPSGTYADGWHTFAADWEPGSITYYYDGVDIGSVTSGVTSTPMFLILDNVAGGDLSTPATMKVAYVRVWQHP
jgi:Glycosyl hydrolases family 16